MNQVASEEDGMDMVTCWMHPDPVFTWQLLTLLSEKDPMCCAKVSMNLQRKTAPKRLKSTTACLTSSGSDAKNQGVQAPVC